MIELQTFVREVFLGDTIATWVVGLLAFAPILDWIFGVLRSFRDGSFKADALDVFVRTQYAGRVVPLVLLILLGRTIDVAAPAELQIPGLDLSVLVVAGIAPAVIYLGVTVKSIIDNATVGVNKAGVVPTE